MKFSTKYINLLKNFWQKWNFLETKIKFLKKNENIWKKKIKKNDLVN